MAQCTAKAKSTGNQCNRSAVEGSTKCTVHGGLTPKGIASPHFKTGRHSKYIPVGIMDTYHAHLADENKLVLDSEIALVDTRISEIIEDLGDYNSADLWYKLYDMKRKYQSAKDEIERLKSLTAMLELIEMGASYTSKWAEIYASIEQRRKLVESERKRLVEAQQTIQVEQALVLVTALLNAVKSNVSDKQALIAIQSEFNRLVGANHQ